jgi:uncharacterized protein (DUF2126 family)
LHPTIPVHAPLVFEIVDRWKERSVGRCTYFVEAPHGRAYSARPANAAEAAERRKERFEIGTPSADRVAMPQEEKNPTFPMTLDLRMPSPGQKVRTEKPGTAQ